MAGMDYLTCSECGKRLIYDGEWDIRNELPEGVTCDNCVAKLKKKIEKLKKHDRRKH